MASIFDKPLRNNPYDWESGPNDTMRADLGDLGAQRRIPRADQYLEEADPKTEEFAKALGLNVNEALQTGISRGKRNAMIRLVGNRFFTTDTPPFTKKGNNDWPKTAVTTPINREATINLIRGDELLLDYAKDNRPDKIFLENELYVTVTTNGGYAGKPIQIGGNQYSSPKSPSVTYYVELKDMVHDGLSSVE
jgi:hypothetical protein